MKFFGSLSDTYKDYKDLSKTYDKTNTLVRSVKTLVNDFSSVENMLKRQERLDSSIYRFKNKFKDVSRSNLFLLEITEMPRIFDSNTDLKYASDDFLKTMGITKSEISKDFLSLLCISAPIPSKSININTIKYSGLQVPFPGTMDYDSITIRFVVDMEMKIISFFNVWMSAITGRFNNQMSGMEYLDNIKCKIRINKLNRENKKMYISILEGAFPISISEVTNNTGEENVNTVDVKFAYVGEILQENERKNIPRSGLNKLTQKASGFIGNLTSNISNFKIF